MQFVNTALVITTINSPRKEIKEFAGISGINTICVGDKKSPGKWAARNVTYLSPKDQDILFPAFSKKLPWNCYGRKNIGYLYAIKNKFKLIAETDDDVFPYKNFPTKLKLIKTANLLTGDKFINIYNFFSKEKSWPRGFPLTYISRKAKIEKKITKVNAPVQNFVIDKDSDFDAIYRLISNKQARFRKKGSFALGKGNYCPLNSQCTFFDSKAYPLLYMPSFIAPRLEDILRGYITQRLLWEINSNLVFNYPVSYTKNRNKHDLLKDFKHELPLYLNTENLISVLDSISLSKDLGKSLIKIYERLVKEEIVIKEELAQVKLWIEELGKYT
jgi:hypothetical protein